MVKNNIDDFSKDELVVFKKFIDNYSSIKTIKSEVDRMIEEKERQQRETMNYRLTIELMEKLHFFDSELFSILKSHNIRNIQDLIDSDLSSWNLTTQRRLELEEAKVWYDFSRMEEEKNKINKKRK